MPIVDTATKHRLLLQWLILIAVMAFVLFVVWHQGLIELLLGYDRSRISLAILISSWLPWRGKGQSLAGPLAPYSRSSYGRY